MEVFNKIEQDIATEIVNIGLAKAGDSLSFFTQEKVFISGKDLKLERICDNELFKKSLEPLTVLSTEIRGDMKGYCYLIFDKEDTERLFKLSFPASILENKEHLEEMGTGMLMEMDNIITAAVVTQFSNLFQLDMHGYVPEFFKGTKKETIDHIMNHAEAGSFLLHFSTSFSSGETDISPEFLWCLDESFVNAIKSYTQKDKVVAKSVGNEKNL